MDAMRILTATEISRNFSRVLDELARGGEEVVVMRGKHPVAKMVPGALRLTALEVLADLYRTLDDAEGRAWLKDVAKADRQVKKEMRDPWA
jgi:antitoxin (DNA-binding transcriptional repressor) of toxin-antitoxin stability system